MTFNVLFKKGPDISILVLSSWLLCCVQVFSLVKALKVLISDQWYHNILCLKSHSLSKTNDLLQGLFKIMVLNFFSVGNNLFCWRCLLNWFKQSYFFGKSIKLYFNWVEKTKTTRLVKTIFHRNCSKPRSGML